MAGPETATEIQVRFGRAIGLANAPRVDGAAVRTAASELFQVASNDLGSAARRAELLGEQYQFGELAIKEHFLGIGVEAPSNQQIAQEELRRRMGFVAELGVFMSLNLASVVTGIEERVHYLGKAARIINAVHIQRTHTPALAEGRNLLGKFAGPQLTLLAERVSRGELSKKVLDDAIQVAKSARIVSWDSRIALNRIAQSKSTPWWLRLIRQVL